jgi:hypothetical protein
MEVKPTTTPQSAPDQEGGQSSAQSAAPDGKPTAPPRFVSIHTLLMLVEKPSELPHGSIWMRDENNILQQFTTVGVSPDRMQVLHQAVAQEQVYALAGHRYLEFNELGPEWPTTKSPAVGLPLSLGEGEQGGEAPKP